jgi:hypothetical protein
MRSSAAVFTAVLAAAPVFAQEVQRPYSPYAGLDYPTEVFFGDTHVHTSLSGDAGGAGNTLRPRDVYRFARGEEVIASSGQPVKISRPLDFSMVTDHTDALGAIADIISGTPNILADEMGRDFHEAFNAGPEEAAKAAVQLVATFAQGQISPAMNYGPGNPGFRRAWNEIIDAAEAYNDPHKFTAMIAFEWTSLASGNNLHRNVIMRDGAERARMIEPFTATPPQGARDPRKLWEWMENYEELTGGRVLAIPHNGNVSNGMMFPMRDDFADGSPLDAEYAEMRQRFERLYEAAQIKGDGETHPMLSPEDEFADYETWDWGNLDLSEAKTPEMLRGEYVRSGLQRGLQLEEELGTNPYKFGLVAATDSHTGLSSYNESNFFGKFTNYEPNPKNRIDYDAKNNEQLGIAYKSWQYTAAGLTAVWASSNTRAGLWDAMHRRETYGTTGPRMTVRFFGGYGYTEADLITRNMAEAGYAKGVPMGGDLAPGNGAPSFMVGAMRDPDGANLDRVQIVKLWLDAEGEPMERVYDVAWSGGREPGADGKLPPVGSTVDLTIPTWTNTIGGSELRGLWTDPDFDASRSSIYYARVLEVPTPRWAAYDVVKYNIEVGPEVQLITQERAYTSPIWYAPPE